MSGKNTPPVNGGALITRVQNFDEVTPGAWVSENGMLFRVPEEGTKAGHSPMINVVSTELGELTRISENAYIPIGKARELAANADLPVNF